MATHNVYTYSALVIISCLISISVHMQGTWGSSACSNMGNDPKMIARDVITVSVREIQDMRRFVNTIPRLKSLKGTDTSEMVGCVGGLIANLSELKATLQRIRHLKLGPYLDFDARSLKTQMDHTLAVTKVCTSSMKGVDDIFISMFSRKIVDLSLIVDDVLYRVSRLLTNTPGDQFATTRNN